MLFQYEFLLILFLHCAKLHLRIPNPNECRLNSNKVQRVYHSFVGVLHKKTSF